MLLANVCFAQTEALAFGKTRPSKSRRRGTPDSLVPPSGVPRQTVRPNTITRRAADAGNAGKAGSRSTSTVVFTQGVIWDVDSFDPQWGSRAGQGAGPAHHPGDRERDGTPRSATTARRNALIPALPERARLAVRWTGMAQFTQPAAEDEGGFPGSSRRCWIKAVGGTARRAARVRNQGRRVVQRRGDVWRSSIRCGTRIITSPSFTGERNPSAPSLFENTMDREKHRGTAHRGLLVERLKRVVPFLKVDKGPGSGEGRCPVDEGRCPSLRHCSTRPKRKRMFGTKMRSFVKQANRGRHQGHR